MIATHIGRHAAYSGATLASSGDGHTNTLTHTSYYCFDCVSADPYPISEIMNWEFRDNGHRVNWWDWFRTGGYRQAGKNWAIKLKTHFYRAFWLRILPSKSGWVGKAMARKKGA